MTDSGLRVKTRKEAHMKTQLSKPARSKARYTDQYKQEALELWRASGRSAAKVAAELGIRPPLLYRWAHAERVPEAPKTGRKPKRSLEELEAENRRLRAENAKLERTAPLAWLTPTGEHPLAQAHPRGICSQSSDLRQSAPGSRAGLPGPTQPHCSANASGTTLCPAALQISTRHH